MADIPGYSGDCHIWYTVKDLSDQITSLLAVVSTQDKLIGAAMPVVNAARKLDEVGFIGVSKGSLCYEEHHALKTAIDAFNRKFGKKPKKKGMKK